MITENFADGALTVHLQENPNKAADEEQGAFTEEHFAKYASDRARVADFGL